MDVNRRYRLARAAVIRPEPFGGLVYHHETRSLTCLRSRALVDFVRGLDGARRLGEALDEFVQRAGLPPGGRAGLLSALDQLEGLGLFDEQ